MRNLVERLSQGNTLLFVAGGLGVLTALLVFVALSGSAEPVQEVVRVEGRDEVQEQVAVQGVSVVVARGAIPAGTVLTDAFVMVVELPAGSAPAGVFSSVQDALGRVTRFPLAPMEQVLENRLVSMVAGREGLAFSIPPGLRAISIPIINPLGVLVVPGDRIDLLMTSTIGSLLGPGEEPDPADPPPGTPTVYTYMQDVFVLGTGTDFTRPLGSEEEPDDLRFETRTGPGGEILLAVTPQQAQQLLFAVGQGSLSLVLRRFGDHSESVLDPEFKVTPSGTGTVIR
ncbi:MAG: Flp pilus assembly protein CpaB [Dehalococcoidia bacterium]